MALAKQCQVQRAAEKAGVDPKLFCDKGAEIFKVRKRIVTPSNRSRHSQCKGTRGQGGDQQ